MIYIYGKNRALVQGLKSKAQETGQRVLAYYHSRQSRKAIGIGQPEDELWIMTSEDYLFQRYFRHKFAGKVLFFAKEVGNPKRNRVDLWLIWMIGHIVRELSEYSFATWKTTVKALLMLAKGWLFWLIRIPVIYAEVYPTRIGHFAYNTNMIFLKYKGYKGEKKTNQYTHFSTDTKRNHKTRIYGYLMDGMVCNSFLKDLWARKFTKLYNYSEDSHNWLKLPIVQRSRFFCDAGGFGDVHEPLQQYSLEQLFPYINLTREERQKGWEILARWGIPNDIRFICIHVRDSAYLDTIHNYATRQQWAYHDFRDADIKTYLPAMEWLTTQGFYVIRLGAIVKETLETDNRMIIDYAGSDKRSDFMDMFLLENCNFLIGTASGITQAATVLGTRVLATNWAHCEYLTCFRPGDKFIHKHHSMGGIELSFRDILESGIGRAIRTEVYEKAGVELIDNMPEELLGSVKEMVSQLYYRGEEDIELDPTKIEFAKLMDHPKYRCYKTYVMPTKAALRYI